MQPCSKERNMEMKREEKKAGYILWIPTTQPTAGIIRYYLRNQK